MSTSADGFGLLIFDALLLLSILALAWAALSTRDARRSVVLFMAFGLLLAVAWARLLAPDVALAEAAIGAGLSGALLLAALDSAATPDARHSNIAGSSVVVRSLISSLITLGCAGLALMLAWALVQAFAAGIPDRLALQVFAELDNSGVRNPVTAVLLNFRAYDTLLELAVLLTAVLGIFALERAAPAYRPAGLIFDSLVRWLVPILIVIAAYLLWVGAHAPGGAFQAGATLAAAGVVLRLAGRRWIGLPEGNAVRILMAAGVGVFLLVGLALLVSGQSFLGYPPAWAGALILLIETAAMFSIAAILLLAFTGGEVPRRHDRPETPPC